MQGIEKSRASGLDPNLEELSARVVASPRLAKSPRLRNLFLYLCRRTSEGRDGLHERTIGEEVFGRPKGYDTVSENIVRVSVSQLRKRLEEYFEQEGADEPFVISIPKGQYTVEFVPRQARVAEPETEFAPSIERRRFPRWPYLVAAVMIATAAGVLLFRWTSAPPRRPESPAEPDRRFWGAIFEPGRNVYIVVADSGFSLLQDVTGQSLSFDDYLSGGAPKAAPEGVKPPDELVRRILGRQYTSVTDAAIAFELGQISSSYSARTTVRSARSINIRDLKVHNIILLGSARSDPWISLLKDRLNFFVDYDQQPPRGFVRNVHPLAGEPDVFRATARSGHPGETYGIASWVPNLDGSGSVLMLSGTNMEGTEAAADTVLNRASLARLSARLQRAPGTRFPYFEAVIRASSRAGAGSSPEIVALRKVGAK